MVKRFMSKEEFRRVYGIPEETLRKYLRMVADQMPKPYSKYQKILSPAQVEFLVQHLDLE